MKRILIILALFTITQSLSFSKYEEKYKVIKEEEIQKREQNGKTIEIKTIIMETTYEYATALEFKYSDNSKIDKEILSDSFKTYVDNLLGYTEEGTNRKLIVLKNTQNEFLVLDRKEGRMDIYTGIYLFDSYVINISVPFGTEASKRALNIFKDYLQSNMKEGSEFQVTLKAVDKINTVANENK